MRWLRWLFLVFTILASTAALADTVTLRLVSVGPANDGHYYVYPYTVSIDGSSTLTMLMCDDFSDEVKVGQTWVANVSTINDLDGFLTPYPAPGGTAAQQDVAKLLAYKKAAWLFGQLGSVPSQNTAIGINYAVWGLFSGAAFNSTYNNPLYNAAGWRSLADATVPSLPDSYFDDFRIYTPVNAAPGASGTPQEFVGEVLVPEPATLVLLASGLLTVGLRRWRKRA